MATKAIKRKPAKSPAKKRATTSQRTGVRNVPGKSNPITGRAKASGPGTGSGRHYTAQRKKNEAAGQSPDKARANAMSSLVGVQNTVATVAARKKTRTAAAKSRKRRS